MRRPVVVAALLCLLLPGQTAATRPISRAAAAKPDWTHVFLATPEGGFRMGNPKAKLAIVEYASLTCPHCRHFAETAVKPLVDGFVRTGKASYEFRPFVLNGIDLAATLVARCDGPTRFFPIAEQLYATQPEWTGRLGKLPKAEQNKLTSLPQGQMTFAIANATGLFQLAAAHGIPPAKAHACASDEKAAAGLAKIEQAAMNLGVQGTPTFFVNGKQVAAYDWNSLQPFLKEAGG